MSPVLPRTNKRPTIAFVACLLAASASVHAAVITWGGGPRAILSDADVSTNGILVRALAKSGASAPTVNGVSFGPFPGPDILTGQNAANYATGSLPTGGGISSAYASLLSQNDYRTTSGNGSGTTLTLTLNNLLPGHHYEIQLWFHDGNASGLGTLRAKSPGSLDPWVQLDANTTNTAGGRGQHAIGTFTADATTQTIQLTGNPVVALQAYQLRLVSAPLAAVNWEMWRETTGPEDVATTGAAVRAYAFGASAPSTPLNGVTFTRFMDQTSDTIAGFAGAGTDGFGSSAAPFSALPASYQTLLRGGATGGRAGSLTLNNLQPGQWYLVQVWSNDSRAAAGGRIQRINGSLFLNANPGRSLDDLAYEGGVGHWMQGRFRATAASQRLDFVSSSAIHLSALNLRAIPAPEPTVEALHARRLFSLHSYIDGLLTSSNPWVAVQARFATGDLVRARADLTARAAATASGTLVPTSSFHLWPAMDLFIRRKAYIDQLSRERLIATLRKFDYRGWSNTSNLSKLAWTIRTLGSQEFGESSFIFPDNAWRDADPRGYGPLVARLEFEARQGTGEYASSPYGWYNIMPSLSLAQWSADAPLAARARVAFDAHLAQLAAQWMPGGYLATWSGRSYPLAGSAMSLGRLLWFWFGEGGRSGEGQEILMAAVSDYVPPVPILRAASERTAIYTARHRADAFQTAYVYKDQFGFFSHDGSGGGDQQYPDGLRWRGMSSYLWVTRPAVDTPSDVRASNAPGNANADYSTLQHRDAQLMVFDLSYRATNPPYALAYIPGNYSAMINQSGTSTPSDGRPRIFLHYGAVMVAISSDIPFTWDPASGIYCPWPNVRTGDSEIRIAAGGVGFPKIDPTGFTSTIDHANNRFAVAIEVAHPEEFAGATPAAQLTAFQAALGNTTLTRDPRTSPTTARYTTRRGDRLQVTSKSNTGLKTAFVNDLPVVYDDTWPMMENPWMSQPRRGANATLTGGGAQTVLDVTNWTRSDSLLPVTDPLPGLSAPGATGLTPSSATASVTLTNPGSPAATLTLFWGSSDAGTSNPSAWANSMDLGNPTGDHAFANLTGLSANTSYTFRFRAVNASGTVWTPATSFRTPALAPPDVPRNLRFTLTAGQIPLAWDPVAGAASYTIRRSSDSAGPYATIASAVAGTSYTDATAVAGTTYYYVIAANGPGGSSGESGPLMAATASQPSTPTGLSVTTGYRYALLTWNPVPWASGYNVKRGSASTGPFTTIATGVTGTTFEDVTSVHGVRYFYTVSATNIAGESSNSAAFGHTVSVASFIAETSGAWGTVPWFPPSRGLPSSGNSTIVDFDNQSSDIASQQDRGVFTLNQLRFLGRNVTLTGNAVTFAGTNPRLTLAATSNSTVANALTLSANTTFEISGSLALSGSLAGAGNLVKSGNGSLSLAQMTSYTGNLILGGGRLFLGAPQNALRMLTFGTSAGATSGGMLSIGGNTTAVGLLVQTTGAWNQLEIAAGRTLTLNGTFVQGGLHNGISSSHLAVSGGGGFRFENPAAPFVIRRASTLDLSGAGPTTIVASRFVLGDTDNNTGSEPATLLLPADASLLVRADFVSLSSATAGGTGPRGESTSLLAGGGNGTFTIRNTAGNGPALLEIDRNASAASVSTSATVDLRGQPCDIWLSELHLSRRNQTGAARSSSLFLFDSGVLRVDGPTFFAAAESGKSENIAVVEIGGGQVFFTGGISMGSSTNGENAEADLNITGGTVVSGPISLTTANPGYTLGTLTITGGSLRLTGPITRGPIAGLAAGNYNSDGSARLILDGGELDLGGHAIGSAALPIHTVSMVSGALKNVASINGGGGLVKNSPGVLVLDGLNTWTGNTSILTDTLEVTGVLDSPGTLTIGSYATLAGNGTIRAAVVISGTIDRAAALRLERTVRLEPSASLSLRIDRSLPTPPLLAGASALVYGGALRVENAGPALIAGDRFTLFGSASYSGAFTSIELPPLASGLAWDTRELYSTGSLTVRPAAELAASLTQVTKYWDGSAAPGLQSANGVWDISESMGWSQAPDGSGVLQKFWTLDSVHFQTGGVNTVTLNGTAAVTMLTQSVNGTATTISGGRLLLNGPAALSNGAPSGNRTLVLNTPVALNGIDTTFHAAQAITLGSGLAGSGNITKTGNASLTLEGNISWSGGLFLGGGSTRFTGAIPGLSALWFGPTAGSAPGSSLELASDLSLAGASFKLQSLGTNHLVLPAGRTLSLTGDVILGTNTATLTGLSGNTSLTTAGGGRLVIQTGGKSFTVAGSRTGNAARIDLTGLSELLLDAGSGSLFLGVYNSNTSDSLLLAGNSTLTASNFFVGDANLGGTHSLRLGAGSNTLNITNVYIGQRPGANNRSDASLTFGPAVGSVRLRAADGTSRANVFLNDNNSTTGRTLSNTFDVSGGTADLLLDQLVVSRRNGSSSPAQLTNDLFRWDRGTLDVLAPVVLAQAPASAQKTHVAAMVLGSANSTASDTAIFRGGIVVAENRSTVTSAGAAAQGNLTIAGGSITSGDIVLGEILTATAPTSGTRQSQASLTITGGSLTMTGPIRSGSTAGAGNKTATVTLDGGILDLGGNALGGNGTAAITTLTFRSGTLASVGPINGAAGFTKTGNGTLTLAGNSTFNGPIDVANGTLVLAGHTTSSVAVASNATLVPSGSLSGNLTLPAGATLRVRIDSPTSFQRLVLTGAGSSATLGGSLVLDAAPDLPAGARFRVLRNSGNPAAPVVGNFGGRPHLQPFTASGRTWYVDYAAGAGGDVDLVLATDQEIWRFNHFGTLTASGNAGWRADPDGDGMENLLEYALGTNPASAASSSRPALTHTLNTLAIEFLRVRPDVDYIVEGSNTLSDWTTIATNPGAVGETVTVHDTSDLTAQPNTRRFLRLRVQSP